MSPRERPPSGLYIHVPFCVSVCPYCDFVVYAGKSSRGPQNRIATFVEALTVELALRADALDATWGPPGPSCAGKRRPQLESLYLGGGTPSLLPPETIANLIAVVRARFGLADAAEVTLEANPGRDERGDARAFRDAGVTRLSIGVQSFERAELRTLGRRHSAQDVAEAVGEARAVGVGSLSLDLLYDVPGQTLESWSRSLDAALALEPDHLSLYALTVDRADEDETAPTEPDHLPVRRGARAWRRKAATAQDEDRAAAMYELADERLRGAGLGWYEISNWARPGHESRHNLGYWRGSAWEAAGPGAHAFDGARRRWNAARLEGYVAALLPSDGAQPRLPPGGEDEGASTPGEAAMLALRTRDGVPMGTLDDAVLGPAVAWALDHRLIERANERLILTQAGRLLSNEVFARFL